MEAKRRKRKHAQVDVLGELGSRRGCRNGKRSCLLDDAVLARIADAVCTPARVDQLRTHLESKELHVDDLATTWRALIIGDLDIGRAYAMHLIERVELHDDRAVIVPKAAAAGA